MPWTLQRYIFREMGKSFLLTAIGLMGVLGLGGGVLNMIELEGATAVQLLKILALILPLAATLTLPIAALYAATVTYGRLSADNEFVACRSGGINIILLLLPTMVLSLVSAVCSFFFINFLIPGMVMNVDRFVGADLPRMAVQQLSAPGRLNIRNRLRIYADRSAFAMQDEPGGQDSSEIQLVGAAFVEVNNGTWVRFGTAESITLDFEMGDGEPAVRGTMHNLSYYDAKAGSWSDHQAIPIERYVIPRQFPLKVKWLDLGDLIYYGSEPALFPEIEKELDVLRAGIARTHLFLDVRNQFREDGEIELSDGPVHLIIRSAKLGSSTADNSPLFQGGVEIEETTAEGHKRKITCDDATIQAEDPSRGMEDTRVYVYASGNVSIVDSRLPNRVIRRQRERLSSVKLDDTMLEKARTYPVERLIDFESGSLSLGEWVRKKRLEVVQEVDEVSRDIVGVLHSRLAFSISVFVLVILGAVLGILFRGAHVLVAFGISFVPSLFVISAIIMGKQLVGNPNMSPMSGVAVIWAGIAIVAVVDLTIMTKVLRR